MITQTHIRAHQVGAMVGVDPLKSQLALFHQLRGDLPPLEDNELLKEGRYFEDAIAKIYGEKYGYEVYFTKDRFTHGPLSGEPDRFWVKDGEVGVLEVKNTMFADAGSGGWGDPGTDVVPQKYWLQCQVYGHLFRTCRDPDDWVGEASANHVELAARLYHGTSRYRIPIDMQVIEKVWAEAEAFLARVAENNPPSPRDEADMRMRWLVQKGKTVEATAEIAAHCKALAELNQQLRDGEKAASELKMLILGFAQDAEQITDANGKVLATLGSDRVFDEQKFLAENPDLASQCMKLDRSAVKKVGGQSIYDHYMRRPETVMEQKRTIRIREEKK